jgi:cytochrome c-type biogenesis protein CcmH/NrfG
MNSFIAAMQASASGLGGLAKPCLWTIPDRGGGAGDAPPGVHRSVVWTDRMSWVGHAAALLALLLPVGARAVPAGSPESIAALQQCDAIDEMADADRDLAIERGLAAAESTIAADAGDARGHFAVVCYLGKRMERAGISVRQLSDLRRLRRELDRTLELAPGDADALLAKGALLLKLPRLLGGDVEEAEVLLRQALRVEPDNTAARCFLAEAQRSHGASGAPPPGC